MRCLSLAFGLVALFLVAAACGSNATGDSKACVPNTTLVCDCLGGNQGVQSCVPDGSGYSPCECSAPDGANGTDTIDGPDATEDSDTISQVCTEGATQEGTTTCGLNSEGVLMQDCNDGSWVDNTTCTGTDECKSGASQEGTTVCGFNDEGVLMQDCNDGAWVDSATCTGTDECKSGASQEGTTSCGLNSEGVLMQDCNDGAWVDNTTCTSPDSVKAIQFSLEFDVTAPVGGNADVLANFAAIYYTDIDVVVVYCTEHVEVTGTAVFGPTVVPDCPNCTGLLSFDESSVVNITDPTTDPEHCTPAFLDEFAGGYLTNHLTPIANNGYGDFLSIALIDASTMDALGLSLSIFPGSSASELTTQLADVGVEFTHAGYVNKQPGSLSETSGLEQVAANAGGDSPWLGYWIIFKYPNTDSYAGSDMSGTYGGNSNWIITLEQ